MNLKFLSCIAAASFSVAAMAQTSPPACSGEEYRQFDFWLGTWTVTDPSGAVQGTNTITSEEGGCLVLETWLSARGGTGQSYNYYNPATEKWRQVWISQGAMIDYEGGLTATGSMKLKGTITYPANATTADFFGEWTPNEDGTVTQHFEQYDADNETWNPWFTGIYTRVASSDDPEGEVSP